MPRLKATVFMIGMLILTFFVIKDELNLNFSNPLHSDVEILEEIVEIPEYETDIPVFNRNYGERYLRVNITCEDLDSGEKGYFEKSSVKLSYSVYDSELEEYETRGEEIRVYENFYPDFCSDSNLIELVCKDNKVAYQVVNCPSQCVEGRCARIFYNSCSESGASKDKYSSGYIVYNFTYMDMVNEEVYASRTLYDECIEEENNNQSKEKLLKRSCRNNRPDAKIVSCTIGCLDGKCIS